jgi:nitrile hydratase accessory protein
VSGELDGDIAPPMSNGEVVFEAPWQGRVFGMARALAEAGFYTWDEFRASLIREIAAWDRHGEGAYAYYDHFLRALERLLEAKGVVDTGTLERRFRAFRERPHDHDH